MKKLIVANLKMNFKNDEVLEYASKINKKDFNKNVVICPTSIYVPYFLNQKYAVGIQNVFYEQKGAYTGEISPLQAYSMGIRYVIIGHSERRSLGEEDELINKKIKAALIHNIKVILCVGETIEQRNAGLINIVLSEQLDKDLNNISKERLEDLIIAYEPRWAIGSNITPEDNEIEKVVTYIKNYMSTNYDIEAKVLYGGSVSESNIKDLNNIENIDGFLIGGASLSSSELDKIVKVVSS